MIYIVPPGRLEKVLRQFKTDSRSMLAEVKKRQFFVGKSERRRKEAAKCTRKIRQRQAKEADGRTTQS